MGVACKWAHVATPSLTVIEDNDVCSGQIDTQTTSTCGQEKHKLLRPCTTANQDYIVTDASCLHHNQGAVNAKPEMPGREQGHEKAHEAAAAWLTWCVEGVNCILTVYTFGVAINTAVLVPPAKVQEAGQQRGISYWIAYRLVTGLDHC
jgi:hypothetical protein